MRVVYVNATDEIGGSDASLYELVRNLDRTRFEPHVVLPADGPNAQRYQQLGVPVHVVPIHKLHRTWNPLWHFGFLWRVPRRVRQVKRLLTLLQPQIVHINSSVDPMAGYAARKFFDTRGEGHLVWHVRELDLRPKAAERMLFGLVSRWADRVLTISQPLYDRFQDRVPTELVHNGVDLTRFLPNATDRGPGPTVGWVGRLVPWKGLDHVLDVFDGVRAELPNAKLLIAASTLSQHADYGRRIRAAAEQRFGDCLRWLDGTDRPEDAYARMDLFVHLPALREPFGRTLIEAQAAGVPVLSWPRGGIAETLDVERTGRLVPPGDLPAAVRAAIDMLQQPTQLQRMGAAASRFARTKFAAESYAAHVQRQYSELLDMT